MQPTLPPALGLLPIAVLLLTLKSYHARLPRGSPLWPHRYKMLRWLRHDAGRATFPILLSITLTALITGHLTIGLSQSPPPPAPSAPIVQVRTRGLWPTPEGALLLFFGDTLPPRPVKKFQRTVSGHRHLVYATPHVPTNTWRCILTATPIAPYRPGQPIIEETVPTLADTESQ